MNKSIDNVKFEFGASYEKAWQDEKTGKMYVRAIASDDKLDLQRDRMGALALDKMAGASKKGVPFLETHRSTFEFGKTTGGEIIEVMENGHKVQKFAVEIELDGDFPQARKLFKEVAAGNCKRQLSIGGKLNLKNKEAVSIEMTPTGLARTINDLDLDHIAATRENQAANPRTSFVEAVAKALDEVGFTAENAEMVAKTMVTTQNTSLPPVDSDAQAGIAYLQAMGKNAKTFGGRVMKTGTMVDPAAAEEEDSATPVESTPATPASTPASEEITPAEKAKSAPQSEVALKTEAPKFTAKKAGTENAADLANDIALLLSKGVDGGDAVYNSLWTLRHVIAKQAEAGGGNLGSGEQAAAASVRGAGPYAPRDLSAKKASGAYIPDKAPKGDSTDVGGSAVSDVRRDIQIGGEIVPNAPTAKDAYELTMRNLKEAGRLPQVGDNDKFGKSLTTADIEKTVGSTIEKSLSAMLEKSFAGLVEKNAEVTKSLIEVAAENIMKASEESVSEVQKSVNGLGDVVNDASKKLSILEGRINKVEKAGGVSQSGPHGPVDSTVRPSKGNRGGMWGGIFDKSASEALGKY